MIDKSNFFHYVDHFAKTAHIPSIPIFESSLNYIPNVTIAIPTYKRADLLKEALDSALNQREYDNYDVVVIDNNPQRNDETEKLLLTYKNPRLSYYKNAENLGMSGNWNRLYEVAKGEWVVMLHDDDLLKENYLNYLFNKVICKYKDKYTIYTLAFDCINLIRNERVFTKYDSKTKVTIERIHYKDFTHGNIIGAPLGLCIQKKEMMKLGGFNNDYYPIIDYEFYIRASYYAKMVRVSGISLCIYRIQKNESLKIETVQGSVTTMIEILNILNSDKLKGIRYLWNRYAGMVGYYLLQACKNEYKLKDETINKLMVNIPLRISIFSLVIYKFFSFSYKLRKRVSTLIFQSYV